MQTVEHENGPFFMRKSPLAVVAPTGEMQTVDETRRGRKPNAELRTREYLTEDEVERLQAATGDNRNGHRDRTMVMVAFRHGLRVSELINLRWDHVDFKKGKLHVRRLKGSDDSVQPLAGVELRALRRLQRESSGSPFVFISERGAPFTRDGFAKMLARLGRAAGFEWQVHPHMLRHACGYKLVNDGFNARVLQDYLGHRDPRHLVRYTKLSSKAFDGIWKD